MNSYGKIILFAIILILFIYLILLLSNNNDNDNNNNNDNDNNNEKKKLKLHIDNINQLNTNEYEHFIKNYYKPYLLIFTSDTCGNCQQFKPTLQQIASKKICPIIELNSNTANSLFMKYDIKYVPHITSAVSGKLTKEYNGDRSIDSIIQFMNENCH
jgi:thioredoxin-like negative regulator of GroEL